MLGVLSHQQILLCVSQYYSVDRIRSRLLLKYIHIAFHVKHVQQEVQIWHTSVCIYARMQKFVYIYSARYQNTIYISMSRDLCMY